MHRTACLARKVCFERYSVNVTLKVSRGQSQFVLTGPSKDTDRKRRGYFSELFLCNADGELQNLRQSLESLHTAALIGRQPVMMSIKREDSAEETTHGIDARRSLAEDAAHRGHVGDVLRKALAVHLETDQPVYRCAARCATHGKQSALCRSAAQPWNGRAHANIYRQKMLARHY